MMMIEFRDTTTFMLSKGISTVASRLWPNPTGLDAAGTRPPPFCKNQSLQQSISKLEEKFKMIN